MWPWLREQIRGVGQQYSDFGRGIVRQSKATFTWWRRLPLAPQIVTGIGTVMIASMILGIVITQELYTFEQLAEGGRASRHHAIPISKSTATLVPTPTLTPTLIPTYPPVPTATPIVPQVVFDESSYVQKERTSAFVVNGWSQTIEWWCTPSSGLGGIYDVIINVYTAGGTELNEGIVDMCEPGNTNGSKTFNLPADQYKLDIFIPGWWHIKVIDYPYATSS